MQGLVIKNFTKYKRNLRFVGQKPCNLDFYLFISFTTTRMRFLSNRNRNLIKNTNNRYDAWLTFRPFRFSGSKNRSRAIGCTLHRGLKSVQIYWLTLMLVCSLWTCWPSINISVRAIQRKSTEKDRRALIYFFKFVAYTLLFVFSVFDL